MSVVFTGSNERLTWEQIEERYPHQWVGLKDIEFDSRGADIISAVVAVTGTRNEVMASHTRREIQLGMLTMPETFPSNWMLLPKDNHAKIL